MGILIEWYQTCGVIYRSTHLFHAANVSGGIGLLFIRHGAELGEEQIPHFLVPGRLSYRTLGGVPVELNVVGGEF